MADITNEQYNQNLLDSINKFINSPVGESFGDAQGRWTKTPIKINNVYTLLDKLKALGFGMAKVTGETKETTGSYQPGQISIELGKDATFKDLNGTALHEQIHDLLNSSDQGSALNGLYFDLINKYYKSKRAGSFNDEMPAYMGAFKPGEIKDVSMDQRNSYIKDLLNSKISDTVKTKYRRMIDEAGLPINPGEYYSKDK